MLYSLSENVLSVMVNLSNSGIFSATKKNRKWLETHFQYKCDTSHLKAELKFLDFFYSSYRKPGSFFLRKPTDSLMFVHDGVWCECVRACVCLQSGRWVSYLQCSHTHPLLCLINTVLNSSLHTRPRTQTHMHGQTQLCNIFLHDAEGILNMSNFTLTLLSAYAVPPPHHTHTSGRMCVYMCVSLWMCDMCVCP